jgi:hypothetical protein
MLCTKHINDQATVLWIQIRNDQHHFGNLDPHTHQIKIRICIKIKKLDPEPDPHNFSDVEPKCKKYEPILALFQGFEPFFEARIWIWIRIRIRVKSRIRIRILIRINVMRIQNADHGCNHVIFAGVNVFH